MSDKIENRQTVDVKQDPNSIELKAAPEAPMALTRFAEESNAAEASLPPAPPAQTPEPASSFAQLEKVAILEPAEPRHSRGMFRHKLVLAGTFVIALTTLAVTGFDLGFLIGSDGTIDRKFHFTADKDDPQIPNTMDYTESETTRGWKLRPVHGGSVSSGKSGFADDKGRVVIPLRFSAEKVFSERLAAVKFTNGGNWGYINTTGKVIVPALYSKANFFRHGYARVLTEINGREHSLLIDRSGREVDLHGAEPVKDIQGFFVVHGADYGGYGLVKDGKLIIPCDYDEVSKAAPTGGYENYATDDGSVTGGGPDWHESVLKPYFKLLKDGKYGLADSSGKVLFKSLFDDIKNVHSDHALVVKDGHLGFSDFSGKLVVPAQYDQVTRFDDLIALRKGGKIILIDSSGKPVKSPEITNIKIDSESLQWLHDGLGVFRRGNLYGYLDSRGNEVIPPKYLDAQAFDGGAARVRVGSRTIYIDRQGNRVDKSGYAHTAPFKDGKARVTEPGLLYDAIVSFPRLVANPNEITDDREGLGDALIGGNYITNRSNTEFEFDDSETE